MKMNRRCGVETYSDGVETGLWWLARDEGRGMPADCSTGARHEGGVTLYQASVRNVRTCRPDVKGEVNRPGFLRRLNALNRGQLGVASSSLLKRQFDVLEPSKVWGTDIAYIRGYEGGLYLAVCTAASFGCSVYFFIPSYIDVQHLGGRSFLSGYHRPYGWDRVGVRPLTDARLCRAMFDKIRSGIVQNRGLMA
ncbi:hypothetical protein [Pseudomonas sp. ADAK13]|uniref:hypothetical protein n=1 Tax=Pseudomonas sp. ADAK13 TaxID=2730847 RepID=UPI003FA75C26